VRCADVELISTIAANFVFASLRTILVTLTGAKLVIATAELFSAYFAYSDMRLLLSPGVVAFPGAKQIRGCRFLIERLMAMLTFSWFCLASAYSEALGRAKPAIRATPNKLLTTDLADGGSALNGIDSLVGAIAARRTVDRALRGIWLATANHKRAAVLTVILKPFGCHKKILLTKDADKFIGGGRSVVSTGFSEWLAKPFLSPLPFYHGYKAVQP
jgi:hypothetical protein